MAQGTVPEDEDAAAEEGPVTTETLDEFQLENQVFALALKEPGAIEHFYANLPSEDVGLVHGNKGINQFYMALYTFYGQTGLDPVEPIAFKSWIESESDIHAMLGGKEGVDYFFDDLSKIKELSTPEAVTKILRLKADKRRQHDYAAELSAILEKKDMSEADKTQVRLLTAQIAAIEDKSSLDPFAEVMTGKDFAAMADVLWELPDFLPTPFPELNKCLGYNENGGICKGAVSAVLAPSGKGKSTFVKILANYWASLGKRVLVINYEEAKDHYSRIMMSQIVGKNVYLGQDMDPIEKKALTKQFVDKMNEWDENIMVLPSPKTSYYEDLENLLRAMAKTDKLPDAIIIDTINSMFMKKSSGGARWNQYEEMMVKLEKLAKDLGSAIVLTAQENTNRMKENRDTIKQSDTGGGITIVQKCVVTMHIVPVTVADTTDLEDLVDIQIPKNRITGTSFSHNPPRLKYNDDSKSFENYDLISDEAYSESDYIDVPGGYSTL